MILRECLSLIASARRKTTIGRHPKAAAPHNQNMWRAFGRLLVQWKILKQKNAVMPGIEPGIQPRKANVWMAGQARP
jgi:hypothetical protein